MFSPFQGRQRSLYQEQQGFFFVTNKGKTDRPLLHNCLHNLQQFLSDKYCAKPYIKDFVKLPSVQEGLHYITLHLFSIDFLWGSAVKIMTWQYVFDRGTINGICYQDEILHHYPKSSRTSWSKFFVRGR